MSDSIIQLAGYVISGVVALIVASIQSSKLIALIEYRLEQLEKKVDQHNNLDRRITAIEAILKERGAHVTE